MTTYTIIDGDGQVLDRGVPVEKIDFYTLNAAPNCGLPYAIPDDEYDRDMAKQETDNA